MCGIAICPVKDFSKILTHQQDRGLDSLGYISLDKYEFYRCKEHTLLKYTQLLDGIKTDKGMGILHHRKASVGAITKDNAHPFVKDNITFMQNGTSRAIYKANKDLNCETDSETIFELLMKDYESLEKAAEDVMNLQVKYDDDIGIIIMVDFNAEQILFYSDGKRESNIKLNKTKTKVIGITNYGEDNSSFENIGYLIFDFDMKIIKNEMSINEREFFPAAWDRYDIKTYVPPKKVKKAHTVTNYNNYNNTTLNNWDNYYTTDVYGNNSYTKTSKKKDEVNGSLVKFELTEIGFSEFEVDIFFKEGYTTVEQIEVLNFNEVFTIGGQALVDTWNFVFGNMGFKNLEVDKDMKELKALMGDDLFRDICTEKARKDTFDIAIAYCKPQSHEDILTTMYGLTVEDIKKVPFHIQTEFRILFNKQKGKSESK